MHRIYTLLLRLLIVLTLPVWVVRYYTTDKYRGTLLERLGALPPEVTADTRPTVWVHAVSVGEALAAQGLVEGLRQRHPDHRILFSTVTRTGRLVSERLSGIDQRIYLPLDLPRIVARVVNGVRPRLLVVLETELWPNLFRAVGEAHAPVVVVNGRLSPNSYRGYHRLRWFMRRFLEPVALFAMQSEMDADRMRSLGVPPGRVKVTGNIKYDQALRMPDPAQAEEMRARLGEPAGVIWIAASTHPGEEEAVLEALSHARRALPEARLILVPRHPDRADEVERLASGRGWSVLRLSRASGVWDTDILLADQVGWLMRLYGWARVAFVGGSLIPHGGQNLLEPAAWGIPMVFGPHMFNFRDATRMMLEGEGGVQISSPGELPATLTALLTDLPRGRAMGLNARRVVEQNAGALLRTLDAVDAFLQ